MTLTDVGWSVAFWLALSAVLAIMVLAVLIGWHAP